MRWGVSLICCHVFEVTLHICQPKPDLSAAKWRRVVFVGLAIVHLSWPVAPDIRPLAEWHFWVTSCTFSMYHLMSQNLTHTCVSIWMDGHDARGNNANRHPSVLVKMTASITYNRVRSSRTSLTGDRKIKQTLSRQRKAALDLERCETSQWAALQFRAFYSQVINLI